MADYAAFPIWLGDGGFMIRPESLPLPDDLVAALADWSGYYDETLSRNGYEWPNKELEHDFVNRGRDLARAVAGVLGSAYTVLYFNEETGDREPVPRP